MAMGNCASSDAHSCDCLVSYVESPNGGSSWSPPVLVPQSSGLYGSSLTTGITLTGAAHHGRLVTCMRKTCRNSCPDDFHSFAAYSDDRGRTWHASAFLPAGTTECQIAELSSGQLCKYPSFVLLVPVSPDLSCQTCRSALSTSEIHSPVWWYS